MFKWGGPPSTQTPLPVPSIHFFLLFNSLRLHSFERRHGDMRHQSIELLFRILRVGPLSGQSDAESVGNGFNALGPNGLVQRGVHTDVAGAHVLLGKGLDGFDGFWGPFFESASKEMLVEVDGVVPGHHFLQGRTSKIEKKIN